jgi:hypothetical protein
MDYNHEKVFDIILIFGLLIILIVALQMNSTKRDIADDSHISDCLQDSECVLVNANCCGCDNNGTKTAVNKYYIGYWNERLYRRCLDASCPDAASQDLTCFAEARCINNKCVPQAFL